MTDSFSAEDWRVLPLRGFDELRILLDLLKQCFLVMKHRLGIDRESVVLRDQLRHPGPVPGGL